VNIFETNPSINKDEEESLTINLFTNPKETISVINLEITDNDLHLSTGEALSYMIIKIFHTDDGEQHEFLAYETVKKNIDINIKSVKFEDPKIRLICFRPDSNARLLGQARNLQSSNELELSIMYTKSEWKLEEEQNSEGLSTGVMVGIAVGVIFFIIIVGVLIGCLCKKKKGKTGEKKKKNLVLKKAEQKNLRVSLPSDAQSTTTSQGNTNPYVYQNNQ
jgi:hypothetical protein